ncbi:malonyl-CoA-[acyl-carrier-protein] transacylase [Haemophilus influenzae]|uniref:Malonyl-CoA-[acyl-carrier-protein] transacylase n=1 Tax=Haemophilus influenzae TaxID=727 RepID=A0A2X1PVP7_HAEIF|nr:malonyl-CoA-[acyl-carrier-protein] transacylase [Haemophilus influenzae]
MQQAVPEGTGAMYAIIGLDNEAIINALQTSRGRRSRICGEL